MKLKFKAIAHFSVIAIALMATACSTDPDSSGLEYMPDMYRSPAIEPYVDYGEVRGRINEDFKMKRSAMVPPKYAIPYWGTDSATVAMMLPYHRKPGALWATTHGLYGFDYSTQDEYALAVADMNAIKLSSAEQSDALFTKGKALYQANCNHCHGEKGDGNGPMVTAGSYTGAANFKNLTIADGQMFYSIYYGKNMMGAHYSILNKQEIWTLIHYIRRLQDENYGKFKDGQLMATATAAAPVDSIPAKK